MKKYILTVLLLILANPVFAVGAEMDAGDCVVIMSRGYMHRITPADLGVTEITGVNQYFFNPAGSVVTVHLETSAGERIVFISSEEAFNNLSNNLDFCSSCEDYTDRSDGE